jgi:hypothetical protein
MKFLVTAVTLSRLTRRRRGKARTEVIDTLTDLRYRVTRDGAPITEPKDVERCYEHLHEEFGQIVKVVDVREVQPDAKSVKHLAEWFADLHQDDEDEDEDDE